MATHFAKMFVHDAGWFVNDIIDFFGCDIIRHHLCGFMRSSRINSFVMLLVLVFEPSLVLGPSQLLAFTLQTMEKTLIAGVVANHFDLQTSQSETALLVKWKHIVELLHTKLVHCGIPCSTWVWIQSEK